MRRHKDRGERWLEEEPQVERAEWQGGYEAPEKVNELKQNAIKEFISMIVRRDVSKSLVFERFFLLSFFLHAAPISSQNARHVYVLRSQIKALARRATRKGLSELSVSAPP